MLKDGGRREIDGIKVANALMKSGRKTIEGALPGLDKALSMAEREDGGTRRLTRIGATRVRIFKDE